MSTTVPFKPQGMPTLSPHLVCAGAAAALDFYARAFNAVEIMRLPDPSGRLIHASMRIAESVVMLVDEFPAWNARGPLMLQGTPVTLHLFVPDVDVAVAQAVAAGAELTMPPADMFWGDRYAVLKDPYGHSWSLATHQQDLSPEQIQQAFTKMCAAQ